MRVYPLTIAAVGTALAISCAAATLPPPPAPSTAGGGDMLACPPARRVIVYGPDAAGMAASGGAVVTVPLPEVGAAAVCLPPGDGDALDVPAEYRIERDPVMSIPPMPRQPATAYARPSAVIGQWHLSRVQASAAWQRSVGSNVTVAVIDTGVDCTHPGLRCTAGADYVGGRPQGPGLRGDGNGHGTHVAGTVAEVMDSEGGTGVAPAAVIQPMRVLDDGGQGYTSTIARAILDAGRPGVIVNMSLGGPTGATAMRDAIAAAARAGAIIVAARGNAGSTAPVYPVCYEPVVGVAATDAADRRPPWSSYGDCTDVAAPGVDIVSTYPGGGYATLSGTSMASPVTAGTVALLVALGDRDPAGTLVRTMDAAGPGIPGRVNAWRAVSAVVPGPTVTAGPTATEAPPPTDPPGPPYPAPATGTPTPAPWPVTPIPPTTRPTVTRTPRPTATRTLPGSCEAAGLVEKRSAIIGRFCAPR